MVCRVTGTWVENFNGYNISIQFIFFIDQLRALKGQQKNCHNINRVWTFHWWKKTSNYFDSIEIKRTLPTIICYRAVTASWFFFKSHVKHWKVLINVFMHVPSDANSDIQLNIINKITTGLQMCNNKLTLVTFIYSVH